MLDPDRKRRLEELLDPASIALGAMAAGPVLGAAGYAVGRAGQAVVSRVRAASDKTAIPTIKRLLTQLGGRAVYDITWRLVNGQRPEPIHREVGIVPAAGVLHPLLSAPIGVKFGADASLLAQLYAFRIKQPEVFFEALTKWLATPAVQDSEELGMNWAAALRRFDRATGAASREVGPRAEETLPRHLALQRRLDEFLDPVSLAVGAVAAGPAIAAASYGLGRAAQALGSTVRKGFDQNLVVTVERLLAYQLPKLSWAETHALITARRHRMKELTRALKAAVVHPFFAPASGARWGATSGSIDQLREYRLESPKEFFLALGQWLGRPEAQEVPHFGAIQTVYQTLLGIAVNSNLR